MDTKELLVKVFEHHFRQYYDKYYRLNQGSNEKLIDNFFKRLSKRGYHMTSIGEDFLNRWFRFHFEYWQDKEIKRKPTLNWFIGIKAINRFFDVEDVELKNYWVNKNTSNLSSLATEEEDNLYEESLKQRYLNTDYGLIFCLENTSLYSKCLPCIRCKFKEECKKLLKENYPLLWKRRMKK